MATRVRPPGSTQVDSPVRANGRRSTWRGSMVRPMSVGETDSSIIGRVGHDLLAQLRELALGGAWAHNHAIPTGFAHGLRHQLVQVVEGLLQAFLLAADIGLHVRQDRVLVEVVFDNAWHVGIDRLVVRHARPDRVGQRHVTPPAGLEQAGYAEHAVLAEGLRVEEGVVNAAVDDVDPLFAGGGAHEHLVVLDQHVPALDERHAHLAGKEDVLEIGRVVNAGGEQSDGRVRHAPGCDLGKCGCQARAVAIDVRNRDSVRKIRECPHHQVAVLDHIGNA
jgi:hypothetical protein